MTAHVWVFLFFFVSTLSLAQQSLVLRPDAMDGQDAKVFTIRPDDNFGSFESLTAYTWTFQGQPANKRFYIKFDLSALPTQAEIQQALLSLYYNPTDPYESFDVHTGDNALVIQRVIEDWDEQTITWNNQPATTVQDEIMLPASSTGTQDYLDMDVTAQVTAMLDLQQGNHGFGVRLLDEVNYYKSVVFAASNHPNPQLHPQLTLIYTLPNVAAMPIDSLVIPSAFSPNGDGHNDTWYIERADEFGVATIRLFNRWGQLILEGDAQLSWDGKLGDQPMPGDAYMYVVTFAGTSATREGYVVLLR